MLLDQILQNWIILTETIYLKGKFTSKNISLSSMYLNSQIVTHQKTVLRGSQLISNFPHDLSKLQNYLPKVILLSSFHCTNGWFHKVKLILIRTRLKYLSLSAKIINFFYVSEDFPNLHHTTLTVLIWRHLLGLTTTYLFVITQQQTIKSCLPLSLEASAHFY